MKEFLKKYGTELLLFLCISLGIVALGAVFRPSTPEIVEDNYVEYVPQLVETSAGENTYALFDGDDTFFFVDSPKCPSEMCSFLVSRAHLLNVDFRFGGSLLPEKKETRQMYGFYVSSARYYEFLHAD
jgi:hypothetical protein